MKEALSYRVGKTVFLSLLVLFVCVPLYVILTTALKTSNEARGGFRWWPQNPTLAPFADIWSTLPLASYLVNSLIVTVSATAISVLIAVLAGYALSRFAFRGKQTFSLVILSTQMFPGILFLLPLFLMFTQIQRLIGVQLNGSYLGLIITYITFTLPFSIWMMTGYFASVSLELEEAAQLDGLSRLGALFRIILPVARPGVLAVTVYAFINSWGEVLFASVLTNSETRTLAIGLQAYASNVEVHWNEMMAASLVVSLPILLAFVFIQRHIVAGLSAGSVK